MIESSNLKSARNFWGTNPCGVHGAYEHQKTQRYAMEPGIPAMPPRIANSHDAIPEVGCGQGIGSTILCAEMRGHGKYHGIDYSEKSIKMAAANASILTQTFAITPTYCVGNAEALDIADGTFDCVYSLGVIHHTANEHAAISEVLRCLIPGGKAYVFLYRKPALKVSIAKFLRVFQPILDAVTGTDRYIYGLLLKYSTYSKLFGTMFHECFGVPHMKLFSEDEIRNLFAGFCEVRFTTRAGNFGRLFSGRHGSG